MATQYRTLHPHKALLEDARTHERGVTYTAVLTAGFVIVLIGRELMIAATENATEQSRLLIATLAMALFVISVATVIAMRQMYLGARARREAETLRRTRSSEWYSTLGEF